MNYLNRKEFWMKSGIYLITNIINGKIYVGSTNNFYERNVRHRRRLKIGTHDNPHLRSAVLKYGIDNFVFSILEYCEVQNLIEREQFWINKTNCCNNKIGYNCKHLANSSLGMKLSDLAKENLRKAHNKPETILRHSAASKFRISNLNEQEKKAMSERMRLQNIEWRKNPEIKRKNMENRVGAKYLVFAPDGDVFYTERLKSFCNTIGISYSGVYKSRMYDNWMIRQGKKSKDRSKEYYIENFDTKFITPQMNVTVS